jgi:hypothetical protein
MLSFSNDADILKYEPILFGELHQPQQVLTTGTGGTLSGTTFTASGANFISAQVSSGGVIYLQSADGMLDGAYEIISVDSATQLSISVIRADSTMVGVAPPAATDISYRVSTFGPQTNEIAFQLTEYFAVISTVYAMLASKAKDENFWKKSMYYQKLFARARERCRLSIDIGSEGVADITKVGASGKLVRD